MSGVARSCLEPDLLLRATLSHQLNGQFRISSTGSGPTRVHPKRTKAKGTKRQILSTRMRSERLSRARRARSQATTTGQSAAPIPEGTGPMELARLCKGDDDGSSPGMASAASLARRAEPGLGRVQATFRLCARPLAPGYPASSRALRKRLQRLGHLLLAAARREGISAFIGVSYFLVVIPAPSV
jgi:hypothetical protein